MTKWWMFLKFSTPRKNKLKYRMRIDKKPRICSNRCNQKCWVLTNLDLLLKQWANYWTCKILKSSVLKSLSRINGLEPIISKYLSKELSPKLKRRRKLIMMMKITNQKSSRFKFTNISLTERMWNWSLWETWTSWFSNKMNPKRSRKNRCSTNFFKRNLLHLLILSSLNLECWLMISYC